MATVRFRKDGRITIPRVIRAAYHLVAGSELVITPLDGERFEVRVLPPHPSIPQLVDRYTQDGEAPDMDAEREAFGAWIVASFEEECRVYEQRTERAAE